jgi:hypothetical protein
VSIQSKRLVFALGYPLYVATAFQNVHQIVDPSLFDVGVQDKFFGLEFTGTFTVNFLKIEFAEFFHGAFRRLVSATFT